MSRGSVERNSRNTPQGLMNVATFYQYVARGLILLAAVLFDRMKRQRA